MQNFKHIVVKQDQPTYPITSNRSKGKFVEYKNKIAGSKLQKSPGVYFVSDGGDDVIGEDAADVGVRRESFSSLLCKHHYHK